MLRVDDYPEISELVVGTVQNVKNYGAFITLDEYNNKEGFIHVAEVTGGWVKYIRDYIKEGQKVVCKVLKVDRSKGHIDLSLKRVNEHQKREKIQMWKNEQKAQKLLEIAANKINKNINECYEEFGFALIEKYGTLYNIFELCTIKPTILKEDGFKGDWIDVLKEVAINNISPPYVNIVGYIDMTCPLPDGINHIKNALMEAKKTDDVNLVVQYVGAPKYRLGVKATDYKTAESELKKASERAIDYIQNHGGSGKFYKED